MLDKSAPLSLVYPFRRKQTWMLDGGAGAVTDEQPSNHQHVRPKKENGAAAVNAGGDLMNVVPLLCLLIQIFIQNR